MICSFFVWLAGCFLSPSECPLWSVAVSQTAETHLKWSEMTGHHPDYVSSSFNLNSPFVFWFWFCFLESCVSGLSSHFITPPFKWTDKCEKRKGPRGLFVDAKLGSLAYRGSRRHQVPHVCLFWLHRYLYSPCCLVYSLLYATSFFPNKVTLEQVHCLD